MPRSSLIFKNLYSPKFIERNNHLKNLLFCQFNLESAKIKIYFLLNYTPVYFFIPS